MLNRWRRWWSGRRQQQVAEGTRPAGEHASSTAPSPPSIQLDIEPGDPLIAYLEQAGGAVDLEQVHIDSPALEALRAGGVKLVVPLLSQGELIGLLNLGPRLSEQEYSSDDRALLDNLAVHATPAVMVAQLVQQQQAEAEERQRLEQELQVARLIQHTLLPKELPTLRGWEVAVHYQPAKAVGGDFYDFYERPDGCLVIMVGDVTDKGVPAALVMATTRAVLRGTARRMLSPGAALVRTNELLVPEIPPNMFVTCLYAILDPRSGRLSFANAGHDLPYRRGRGGVDELHATGMPLGLMPGMHYDEREVYLHPGDCTLLYSDGLVEAHNRQREMFSFPRLKQVLAQHPADEGPEVIRMLLGELERFTGPDWEQEDDITLLTILRCATADITSFYESGAADWVNLADFALPSEMGHERVVVDRVVRVLESAGVPARNMEPLKTAVAEATMNAIEHGNLADRSLPVSVHIRISPARISIRIRDHGGGRPLPQHEAPDLEAKLAGRQSPRGWGLFLIEHMVDEMRVTTDDYHRTVELLFRRPGVNDGDPSA